MSEEELKRIELVGGVGRLLVAEVRQLRAALGEIAESTSLDAATKRAREALASSQVQSPQRARVTYATVRKGFDKRR